jgi:molecular chaperone Hsp33
MGPAYSRTLSAREACGIDFGVADLLYRGRLEGCRVAFAYTVTTDTVAEAVRRHGCDPVAAHLLGRALTGAVLSSVPLGEGERLNARWAYEGRLRTVVVDTGPDGATRGFISPPDLAEAEDAGALYGGRGEVKVVRSRAGVIVSSGTVEAALQDVVQDLVYFLCMSDQVETAALVLISLRPDPEQPIRVCRGLLLHALPGADLARFDRLRQRLDREPVREWMSREQESDSLLENVLHRLLDGEDIACRVEYDAAPPPHFRCTCGRDKMGAVLRALPIPERMTMVQKKEEAVVHCRFCGQRYVLTLDDCIRAWNTKPEATGET